ncbi:DUF2268 domain-containing putative Zn-dependent protease [Chitinophaga lutea]
MLKQCLTMLTLILTAAGARAQQHFPTDPDSSVFLTEDIDRFWKAFDHFKQDTTKNPFGKEYIGPGSQGVKGFTPDRIRNAEHLYNMVKKRLPQYEAARAGSLQMKDKEKQSRSAFYALKYWYPQAQFPPVYFVIGAYNSGGTADEKGLYIGAERIDASIVPYLVAHELIHFQQRFPPNPTLLEQSILEGSADFLGELISGFNTNFKAFNYGNAHEEALCREFVTKMDSTSHVDWLYDVSKKDDRPNDLGYWMGYKIAEAYFRQAADKKQAIYDILNVRDFKAFTAKSGYLQKYLPKKS